MIRDGHFHRLVFPSLCAFCCLLLVSYITKIQLNQIDSIYLIASMGAAAVLMFAAPSSPMAQPIPFIIGNISAAFIGVSCRMFFGDNYLSASFAVGLALFFMLIIKCPHPPGGATALFAVIGGEEIAALGYAFVIYPVLINVLIFLAFVLLVRKMDERFTQKEVSIGGIDLLQPIADNNDSRLRHTNEDYQFALSKMGKYIDVSKKDLGQIYFYAQINAMTSPFRYQRCFEACQQAPDISYGSTLLECWEALQQSPCSVITVTDNAKHILGLITPRQFYELVGSDGAPVESEKLLDAITPSNTLSSPKPEAAGQIMTDKFTKAYKHDNAAEAMTAALLADNAIIVVLDDSKKCLGVINTQQLPHC